MSQEPLFWYRPRTDGGYEGPIHNSQIEDVRKTSGAWVPLFASPAPVNAEPVGYVSRDASTAIMRTNLPEGSPLYAAPVATQPDLTQQTLDDVMAGIPARDAEIEALRKEIETLRAQQPVSGADGALVADERELVALAVKHHIRFPRNRDLIAFIDEARASLAIAQPATQLQPSGNSGELYASFESWRKSELPWTSPATTGMGFAWDAWRARAALAQQDVDKVDAERYQAWRDALITGKTAEDDFIRLVADSLPTSVGVSRRPTAAEWDAAIDAARKENSNA